MTRVESWLKEQYSETPLTYKARQKELAGIVDDEKMSEEQKISLLRQKFPKVFQKKESPLIFQPPLSWDIKDLGFVF